MMRSRLAALLAPLRQLAIDQSLTSSRPFTTSARIASSAEAATASGRSEPAAEADYRAIEARIFGNRLGNGKRSGAKVLRKKWLGEKIAEYYPTPFSKNDPAYVSLRSEGQKAKLEKLKRRGKGPPPKGQGKRTAGGKKKK